MSGWVWIERAVVLAIHNEQLAEHGGLTGIRDEGLLESALARPLNLAAHHTPDCADLAAAYGFGICRNHPFMDGNKRTAFVVIELCLAINGYELVAEDADCVLTMFALAAGEFEEPSLAAWIRERSVRR
jgi:death-on-curing protein